MPSAWARTASTNGTTSAAGAGADAFAPPTLIVRAAGATRRRVLAPHARVTIGRSRRCDVVVDDPTVSGRHAVVEWTAGVWITDLGSTFGTRQAGRPVPSDARQPLVDGAVLQLGRDCFIELDDERARWAQRLIECLPSMAASGTNVPSTAEPETTTGASGVPPSRDSDGAARPQRFAAPLGRQRRLARSRRPWKVIWRRTRRGARRAAAGLRATATRLSQGIHALWLTGRAQAPTLRRILTDILMCAAALGVLGLLAVLGGLAWWTPP